MTVTEPYRIPVCGCGHGCVGQNFQPVIFSLQNHREELIAESHMRACRREWAEHRSQRNQG